MSDLEGLTRRLMKKGFTTEKILDRLVQEYKDFKDIDENSAYQLAKAILEECQKSDIELISNESIREILNINKR